MSGGVQPVAVYAMQIPPGGVLVPAVPNFTAMMRITMAAVDPTATPVFEDVDDKSTPRATLKIVRFPDNLFEGDIEDDDDYEDEEEDEDDESGPSDPKLSKKAKLLAALDADDDAEDDEDMVDGDDDEEDEGDAEMARAALSKLLKASKSKGKGKALGGELDEAEDDDEDDEDDTIERAEVVLCTLDPEKHYQQPLDFIVNEGERVFFKVTGTHSIHLTGHYVMPIDDGQAELYDDEEDEYDLSPDEDELDAIEDADEESDELDDLEDPRITEVEEEDEQEQVPTLIKASSETKAEAKATGKGKNKRPAEEDAEDEDEEANLDDIMAKAIKKEAATSAATPADTNGEKKKLTKAEKKALKKQKLNDGKAAPTTTEADTTSTPQAKKEAQPNGTAEKKVQFAKNLEQGPTPSATPPASSTKSETTTSTQSPNTSKSLSVKDVQGVTVDERKAGTGPSAKKGSKLEMRYIGKLEDGKVFDSNKSGKPFSFKLGAGEVIKGWDIGLIGIQTGGERRLTIPAHLAYGKQKQSGIPANSKLIFDIKCVGVK